MLLSFKLWAQENNTSDVVNTVYVIRKIDFDITGRTQPYYLMLNGELHEGERIIGQENFDRYINRRIQTLNNQRVLDDTATKIVYFLDEPEADGAIPVRLLVTAKDAWNFIVLPYPKYDSNDGFSLTLKARDYNFLGTMSPLRIDAGYKLDNDSKHSFNLMFDSDIPFRAFDLDWEINFDHYFNLAIGKKLYYQNVTGLLVKMPVSFTTMTLGFNHYLTFNEEISAGNKAAYGHTNDYYDPYGTSELYASFGIPLGIEAGEFGQLYYTPRVSAKLNYPYSKMDEPHKPAATISHSIGFGRVNWIGNLRQGLTASLGNSNTWNIDRSDAPLEINLDLNTAFYWPFNKIIGFNARLKYRHFWKWSDKNNNWLSFSGAGNVLRGVIDNDIDAYYMLSLNLELPVRVLRFWPSDWLNNQNLRYFNFEMFFSPFFDFAMIESPYSKLKNNGATKFGFEDMVSTTGLEVVVFPAITRSLYIRGSLGYNISKINERGLPLKWGFFPQWDEIYIGVDLHF